MKKIIYSILSILLFSIVLSSCDKKSQPIVPIEKLAVYKDTIYKMEFKYPENWDFMGVPGSYQIMSDKRGTRRFKKYDTKGNPAARIQFNRYNPQKDSNERVDFIEFIDKLKRFKLEYYQGPETLAIDGVDALKFTYTFPLNDGVFNGILVVAEADSNSYSYFTFESFASGMETYKPQVEEMISSLKFAKTPPPRAEGDTLFITEELELPSEETKLVKGKGYTIKIPKNFKEKKGSGNFKYSKKYEGERRADSYITVDIIDAKKQKDLEKIVKKTAKGLKGSNVATAQFGGKDGYVIEQYLAKYQIYRRLYFAKKGDDLYRLTIDYSKKEEKPYKTAFDKAVKSFKIK